MKLATLLNLEAACNYLKWTEYRLLHAVADDDLRAGVVALGWKAYSLPSSGGHRWDGQVIADADGLRTYRFKERQSGAVVTTQEFMAAQFWYLSHSSAYALTMGLPSWELILENPDPDSPHPNAWVSLGRNPQYGPPTKHDLRFVPADLDAVRPTPAPAERLHPLELASLRRVIIALCKKTKVIEPQAHGAATAIARLTELHGDPVSDDTVRRLLKKLDITDN